MPSVFFLFCKAHMSIKQWKPYGSDFFTRGSVFPLLGYLMFKMLPELCVNPFLEYVFLWTKELNFPKNRNLTLHSTEDIFSPQRVRFGRRSFRWKHSLRLFLQRKRWPSSSLDGSLGQGGWEQVEISVRSKSHPRAPGRTEKMNQWLESLRSEWTTSREGDVITPRLKLAACISFRSPLTLCLHIKATLTHSCLSAVPSLKGAVKKALCPDFYEELKKNCLHKVCQT